MKWLYIAAECVALFALSVRRLPIWAFRSYLTVSIAAGIMWQPSLSANWWVKWMLTFEPLRLTLFIAAIAEAGYHTTIRMYPAERRSIAAFVTGTFFIGVVILWRMPSNTLGIVSGIRQAIHGGLALALIAACLYFWSKPLSIPLWATLHGLTLSAYATIGAGVGIWWSVSHPTREQWMLANLLYRCAVAACMAGWCIVAVACKRPRA